MRLSPFTFPSPDRPFLDQHVESPQSWNPYSYVRNNPLRFVDPTGQYIGSCTSDVKDCDKQLAAFEAARQGLLNSKSTPASIRRAVGAYGNPGEDNGVNLSITKVVDPKNRDVKGDVGAQEGTGGFRFDGTTFTPATQVRLQTGLTGTDLQSVLIHEGIHTADRADFVGSLKYEVLPGTDPKNPGIPDYRQTWNAGLNITREQAERNAYGIENVFLRSVGIPEIDINRQLAKPPYKGSDMQQRLFPSMPNK